MNFKKSNESFETLYCHPAIFIICVIIVTSIKVISLAEGVFLMNILKRMLGSTFPNQSKSDKHNTH